MLGACWLVLYHYTVTVKTENWQKLFDVMREITR